METLDEAISQMSISMPKNQRPEDMGQQREEDKLKVKDMIDYYAKLRVFLQGFLQNPNPNPDIYNIDELRKIVYSNEEHNATYIYDQWSNKPQAKEPSGQGANKKNKSAQCGSSSDQITVPPLQPVPTPSQPQQIVLPQERESRKSGPGNPGANSSEITEVEVANYINSLHAILPHDPDDANTNQLDYSHFGHLSDDDLDLHFRNDATNGRKPRPKANFFLSPWGLR